MTNEAEQELFHAREMCECGSQQVAEGSDECEICIWESDGDLCG